MKLPVEKTDIERFNKLYHKLIRYNLNSDLKYPEELKNLTTLDISVVNIAATNPEIIVREIAELLRIPNSTLTSALNRLEQKDIVKRKISCRDRRSFSLELTEKGKKVQQAHCEFEQAYFENILSKLDTTEDRKVLLDLFENIAASCEADESGKKVQ